MDLGDTGPRAERPAEGAAVIAVRRVKGGWRDLFRAYQVFVDGQQVGQLRRGADLTHPVLPGTHTVVVQIDWCRSPQIEVTVKASEQVRLVCAPGGPPTKALQSVTTGRDTYVSLAVE